MYIFQYNEYTKPTNDERGENIYWKLGIPFKKYTNNIF